MDKIKKGVRLDHISKIYQDPKTGKDFYAVKDTSLTIEPGSFVTLLGPSGCGKTTTLRMIAGFESPDEGEIYLGDEPINALTPNKRDTAMVFQSYALLPHYNVFDNVAYGLKLRKVPKDEIRERVMHILDLVELTGMEGTTTVFRVEPARITLQRSGTLESQIVFALGHEDRSLYDMGFGALMITVLTDRLENTLTDAGGEMDVSYSVAIENETAGHIDYHIHVRPQET